MLSHDALAAQHVLDLQAGADADRLARLAACCRRTARQAVATAVAGFFRHGQLAAARTCCPWPV